MHGNPEQCLVAYQKCLEEERLAELVGLPEGTAVHFELVEWPPSQSRSWSRPTGQREFRNRLAITTYKAVLKFTSAPATSTTIPTPEEISTQINLSREPVVIGVFLDALDYFAYPRDVLRWFSSFWDEISVSPYQTCLIFCFITRREAPNRSMNVLRKLIPIDSLGKLLSNSEALAPAWVLPELASIRGGHVVSWGTRYGSRIENYVSPAFVLIDKLEAYLENNGNEISMRQFADVTLDLLQISHSSNPE